MKGIVKKLVVFCLILVLGLVGVFTIMTMRIQTAYDGIEPLELEETSDGTYRGTAGSLMVSVDLNVIVKNHKIEDIEIINQNSGSDYKALDTITRILGKQEAKVDAVSGATLSSKSIMAATYDALERNQ